MIAPELKQTLLFALKHARYNDPCGLRVRCESVSSYPMSHVDATGTTRQQLLIQFEGHVERIDRAIEYVRSI